MFLERSWHCSHILWGWNAHVSWWDKCRTHRLTTAWNLACGCRQCVNNKCDWAQHDHDICVAWRNIVCNACTTCVTEHSMIMTFALHDKHCVKLNATHSWVAMQARASAQPFAHGQSPNMYQIYWKVCNYVLAYEFQAAIGHAKPVSFAFMFVQLQWISH